MYKFHRNGKIP